MRRLILELDADVAARLIGESTLEDIEYMEAVSFLKEDPIDFAGIFKIKFKIQKGSSKITHLERIRKFKNWRRTMTARTHFTIEEDQILTNELGNFGPLRDICPRLTKFGITC